VRATSATDIVADLNYPQLGTVRSVVSHAFFEHVYRNDRLPHLRAVKDALEPDGWMLCLGLPDFREIAQLYLERSEGNISPRFDLFEVYRYTHGDPEHAQGWWLAQLHKGLFDREELDRLLGDAGLGSWIIGNYAYVGEPHPVNLCFFARVDSSASIEDALDASREFPQVVDPAAVSWATKPGRAS
jgi:predicted SAM-dependent methyltransferase